VAQYLVDLADYRFTLVHKPGVSNRADHLSQRPDYDEGKGDNEDVQVLLDKLFANAIVSLDVEQAVYDQQAAAMVQIQGWAKDHGLVSINHHWFKENKPVVADNLSLRQSVLRMYHDHESAGHPGIFNMYASVARDY
jgi:Integrase zinc binding domain